MLLYRLFQFNSLTLPNILIMWFCVDVSKNIHMYRIMRHNDAKQFKEGKHKLSNMKYLMKHVFMAAVFLNDPEL